MTSLLYDVTYYLGLYWVYNAVDSPPLVAILGLPPDDAEALKDINDIVNPSALYPQLSGALIKEQQILLFFAIYAQKSAAELSQRFFFPIVFRILGIKKVAVS